jgi:hypothetical protein
VLTFSDRPDEDYELVTVVLNDLDSGRTEMRLTAAAPDRRSREAL